MKTGASVSGGAHLAFIGLAIFSGALFSSEMERPMNIAEVTLMSGSEFEAALSAAPEFNAELPPAPEAPDPGEERADVTLAETDAAPTTRTAPTPLEAPERGETVTPQEAPPTTAIADVGEREAGTPAPEADRLVSAPDPSPEIAPVSETATAPAPAARPSAPAVERDTPQPPPAERVEPQDQPEPTPEEQKPEPAEEVAQNDPDPAPPVEPQETAEGDTPAPKLSPPPRTKPRDIAEAAQATREARTTTPPEETGATRQAEAPSGGGTTRTVGQLSYRDREALRVGIRGYFSPPTGLPNADALAVKLRIEVSEDGKIIGGPDVLEPSGRLDAPHDALMRAGVRALKRSEAAGVFAKLPKDRYARWRVMNVIFTPREIQFL
ncbi:MAG: hypothetical protein ACK5MQ_10780 [Pikeienuella sp.]